MNKKEWKIFWRLKFEEIWETCKWMLLLVCIVLTAICTSYFLGWIISGFNLGFCAGTVGCYPIVVILGFVEWTILIVGLIVCWIKYNVKKAKRLAKNQK